MLPSFFLGLLGIGADLSLLTNAKGITDSNRLQFHGIFCIICTTRFSVSYITTNHWRATINFFSQKQYDEFTKNLGFTMSIDVPTVHDKKWQISLGIAHLLGSSI